MNEVKKEGRKEGRKERKGGSGGSPFLAKNTADIVQFGTEALHTLPYYLENM